MTDFTLELMKKIGLTDEEQGFVKIFSVKYENNPVYLDLLDKFDKGLIINNDIDGVLEKEAKKTGTALIHSDFFSVLRRQRLPCPNI